MGRILAVDYGRKRVGLAVTDSLQIIANGLTTIPTHTVFDFLKNYFDKEDVDTIVVGYAKQMDNSDSESMKYINPFVNKLKKIYPDINIEMVDERFTSKLAFQAMIDGGVKKKERRNNKGMIDTISATIILQTWMEHKRNML